MTNPSAGERRGKFSLVASVRSLGGWLFERESRPASLPSGKIRDGGRIASDELELLFALANEHMVLHSIAGERETGPPPPRCPSFGQACRAYGAAYALFLGLETLVGGRELAILADTRRTLRTLRAAIEETTDALETYDARCVRLHRDRWDYVRQPASSDSPSNPLLHDHESVCLLPRQLRESLANLAESIASVDRRCLVPQIHRIDLPVRSPAGKRRPAIIAAMQEELLKNGWVPRQVVRVIDDGRGGTERQAIDRMRKELEAQRRRDREDAATVEPAEPGASGQKMPEVSDGDAGG